MRVIDRLSLEQAELHDLLLPKLLGQVFHVTTLKAYAGIKRSGAVEPSASGTFELAFPNNAQSFSRRHDYVSLFDLRTATDDQIADVLDVRLNFLDPWAVARKDPVFLLLSPKAYDQLIPWTVAQRDCPDSMFIWHVEAWFPGRIPIQVLSRAIEVEVKRPPESEFEQAKRSLPSR